MAKHSKMVEKAIKEGKISKKQAEKLPEKLLEGIAKKGDKKGGIKEIRKKASGKVGRPRKGSKVIVER
jgi:polyhydroxyalkanoate synthesis regulator phasin